MKNTLTNVKALEYAISAVETLDAMPDEITRTDLLDKLNKIKEQFEKRANSERKPTAKELAKQEENAALARDMYNFINDGEFHLVGDIAEKFGVSAAKVSSLMKSYSLARKIIKGKTAYSTTAND